MKFFCFQGLFLPKCLKISVILLLICAAFEDDPGLSASTESVGWQAFGFGVLGSTVSEDQQQIGIHVDWKRADWGVGCQITMDSDVNIKEASEIRFRTWTDNGSETKVYLEVKTIDNTQLVYPVNQAKPVSAESQEFRIPLAEMVHSKQNPTELASISKIKILFTKPEDSGSYLDIIHVSNPELIDTKPLASKTGSRGSEKRPPEALPVRQEKASSPQASLAVELVSENLAMPVDAELPLLSGNIERQPPMVVGAGVKDWGTFEQRDQMFVAVKWSQSAEGVAIRFKLPSQPEDELPGMLSFEMRTAYDSRPEVRTRVMSESGITIFQDGKWRPKANASWREYKFKLANYVDTNAPNNSRFIEILVRKPVIKTIPDHELILIRNLRLTEYNSPLEMLADKVETGTFGLPEKTSRTLQMLSRSIAVQGNYTFDYAYNSGGGIESGSSNRNFFDIALTADLQSMLDWENGTATVGFQKYSGENANDLIGDFQGTGSNDGSDVEILSELWVERFFLDDTLRIKLGKVDANSEFAFVDKGAEFINAPMSIASPTISVLPTTPNTAVGANLFVYPYENIYSGFGIYDGATQLGRPTGTSGLDSIFRDPSSLFFIGEVGGSWINQNNKLPSRLGIGVWRHNANFERFDGGVENGSDGFYIVFDKAIWEASSGSSDYRQSLDTFFQYGYASGSISAVEHHLSCGLVMSNPLGNRAEDVSGLGLSWVDFTDDPAAGFNDSFELIIESFYKVQCNSFLSLKADLQYVVNPGGDENLDDTFVPRLRVEASF